MYIKNNLEELKEESPSTGGPSFSQKDAFHFRQTQKVRSRGKGNKIKNRVEKRTLDN